jgi:HAE1 family hydrophobic/amphiphilic exporter-1
VIFLPVVFTRTTSGALFQALALVVVFALACSLFVALTLVPMLSARWLRVASPEERRRSRFVRFFGRFEAWYAGRLRYAIQHRFRVFGLTAACLLGALALWPLIPVELAPQTDTDEIDVDIDMAQGTNIAVVRAYLDELEAIVRETLPASEVDILAAEVRGSTAEVELNMAPESRREHSSAYLADLLRSAAEGRVPGAEIRVRAQSGLWILRRIFRSGGGEEELEIELRGWNLDRAAEIAGEIRRRMERVPGIAGVRVSRREGRPEENLIFDRERIAALGLSVREVGRAVQASVGGVEAGRLRDGGDEIPIVVRLRPGDRLTGKDLDNVSLRTPAGEVVPLSSVIERQRGRVPTEIERVDGQRVTYVSASLESGVSLGWAVERLRADLAELPLPAGFSLDYGGEYREQQLAKRDFTIAILMALALVYMLMAGQFERFLDPLIVMVAVPMALVGVVPALLLTGTTLNLQSVMGLVMLIGIVVNNAIVLVDAINLQRRQYRKGAVDAVLEAARLRLRPILMTTTTTVLGLIPLAVGFGAGAEIQASLARVVIGGLLASTLVTLILIPVVYTTTAGLITRLKAGRWQEQVPETDPEARSATA